MSATRIAVFSDIHANLEALDAVLQDMDALGITDRICLGDIVGYGADPHLCLKRVRSLHCPIVLGNHDRATASAETLDLMSEYAQAGIQLARRKLSAEEKDFLASLPLTIRHANCEFVHASLWKPELWHYIFNEADAQQHLHAQTARTSFCGHTHGPMVAQKNGTRALEASAGVRVVPLSIECKHLVNVGSVGQPRDHRPEACYVIYRRSKQTVEFRRVPYDVEMAQHKIIRANLPPFLADRLAQGL